MTALQPPPLATWLLRQFVDGARNEPLLGDIVEEYRAGRSSFWYWRQVLVAILQSCFKDIRAHRLLALRAVVTTILVYHLLWIFVVNDAMMQIQSLVFWLFAGPHGLPAWPPYFDGLTRALLTLAGAITGWSVARLHRPYESTTVTFVRDRPDVVRAFVIHRHLPSRPNVRIRYHPNRKSHDPGDGRRHGWRICAGTAEGIPA